MKIGIVTVQDSNNFGSFLQAYALQFTLHQFGHEVVFIRSRSKKYIKDLFFRTRPIKREYLHLFKFAKENWNGWKKFQRFQKEQKCFRVFSDYLHLMKRWKLEYAPKAPEEEWHPLFL